MSTERLISVPDGLADDLRIAAVVQLTSACDDFETSMSGFTEPGAWTWLPDRIAALESRIAVVRSLGVVKGEPVAEPISNLVLESLARDAGANVLDDIRTHVTEEADIGAPEVSFGRVTRWSARGLDLLALAEEAGAYDDQPS